MGKKKTKKQEPKEQRSILDKLNHVGIDPVVIIILLLALYIRFINLLDSGFYTDEAHEVLMAQGLFSQTFPDFIISEGEFFHILILKITFILFGTSEFTARLPGLLCALGTIGVVMKFGFDMFKDRKIGYLAGFLMTISAWHIKWSIIARPYSLLMFLALLTMYFAFKAINDNKSIFYYLMAGVLILALFTSRFALLLPFVILIYFAIAGKIREKEFIISASVPVALWLLLGAYVIYNGYLNEILEETSGAWWSSTEPNFYYNLLFDRLTLISLACIGVAVYWIMRKREVKPQVLILFFAVYFIMLGFFFHSKQDRYLAIIIPVTYLMIAYGAFQLFEKIRFGNRATKLIPLLIIFLIAVGDLAMFTPARPVDTYRENYEIEWDEACEYVEGEWTDGDYLLATMQYPVEYYFKAPDYNLMGEWSQAEGIIWGTDIPLNSTVWLVADKGRFLNSLAEWQRDWIWENMDLEWESEHNYVFRSSRFEKVWRSPLDNLTKYAKARDVILTTEARAVEDYLNRTAYEDWNGYVDEYNATFADVVWQNNIPLNVTVWFVVHKDHFNLDLQYWQRDWIWRNFESYWESEYVTIYRGSKFDRIWKDGLDHLNVSLLDEDVILTNNAEAVTSYLGHSSYDDWYGAVDQYGAAFQDVVWQKNIPWGTTVWFVLEKDHYYNSLEFWQRDWIVRNYGLVWENQHLMIYKGNKWGRVWSEPCAEVLKVLDDKDVVLANYGAPVSEILDVEVYQDWDGWVNKYHTSFENVVWHKEIPENATVWFIMEKDHYFDYLEDWQREWIDTNFEKYWESDYTYIFKNDGT